MSIPVEEDEESIFNALIRKAMADCVLPADIMLWILTRLPAKSIHRFKTVSKDWGQLFSLPRFMKMYKGMFSIDPNNESVFLVTHTAMASILSSVYLVNPDSDEKKLKPSIVPLSLSESETFSGSVFYFACCNGLVCMEYYDRGSSEIVLWNPAMEWFKFVSQGSQDKYSGESEFLGFGYDAGGDDYKLVTITCANDEEYQPWVVCVEVYSFNSDIWTKIEVDLKFGVNGHSMLTVNGNPYWYVATGGDYEELVYFDVQLLAFKIVPLPPLFCSKGLRLVDWKGTLGTLQCSHNEEKNSFLEVRVFDDSKITWRLKLRFGPIRGIVEICMQPFKNGNIMLYKKGTWLVLYTERRCIKEIVIRANYGFGSDSFEIFGYTSKLKGYGKKWKRKREGEVVTDEVALGIW